MALNKTNEEDVLVLNGDSFFDVNIERLFMMHKMANSPVSLALRKVEDASRYGTIIKNAESRITSFKEKDGIINKGMINGGVYILNKKQFFENTPPDKNFSIEKDFFETQLTNLSIYGFEFSGYFIDIGIPEDYLKAQHDFKEFKYR